MNLENKKNKKIVSLIINNLKYNWKRKDELIHSKCVLCGKEWSKPLRHLMNECEIMNMKLSYNYIHFDFNNNDYEQRVTKFRIIF